MDDLLPEGPEEPLGDAVCLQLADPGVAPHHAAEADLVPEMLGREVSAMVIAEADAAPAAAASRRP